MAADGELVEDDGRKSFRGGIDRCGQPDGASELFAFKLSTVPFS